MPAQLAIGRFFQILNTACLFAALIVLTLCCSCSRKDPLAATKENSRRHKMAMDAFRAPNVVTWQDLIKVLTANPDFPRDKLPPSKPSFWAKGIHARSMVDDMIKSGGDAARSYEFKRGKTLDDIDACIDWHLYGMRDELAAPAVILKVFVDKDMNIVAYSAGDPGN